MCVCKLVRCGSTSSNNNDRILNAFWTMTTTTTTEMLLAFSLSLFCSSFPQTPSHTIFFLTQSHWRAIFSEYFPYLTSSRHKLCWNILHFLDKKEKKNKKKKKNDFMIQNRINKLNYSDRKIFYQPTTQLLKAIKHPSTHPSNVM